MDKSQIDTALNRLFLEHGKRIVFWHDSQREFEETLASLSVPELKILRLDQVGALQVKISLECEDPTGRYLIYRPCPEPDYDDDWLLDIRLYSHTFRADRASVILDELGLANQSLRPQIEQRKKFFENKDRFKKLQALVDAHDTEADIDRKMLAVLAKADQPELFNIVRTLFHSLCDGESEIDLNSKPPAWELISKFGLDQAFWQMVQSTFGYDEGPPSLRNFLIRLLVTDYWHYLDGKDTEQEKKGIFPSSMQHLLLPASGRVNAVACLSHWRDSSSTGSSYDRLSEAVAEILKIESHLDGLEIENLVQVMTFLRVEQAIASRLRDRVRNTAGVIKADEIRKIAQRRQDGHWASLNVIASPTVPRKALHAVYDALVSAAEFYALRNQYGQHLDFADAQAMYQAYEKELFRFDQLYRHFCEAADFSEAEGWNLLKPLRQEMEACYGNWYIVSLALAWGKFVEPTNAKSLLTQWQVTGVSNQQHFFKKQVAPRADESEGRKVYVIISDAFRYEAAQELTRELNGKYRFQAELSSHLGVLPSYTGLGMASLLPHQQIAYKPNGDILVDGKPASSLEQRGEVLAAVQGVAVKAETLLSMRKEDGREFVRGKQVIYIFHDAIDAFGDKAATEGRTFEGVRKAINELADLVRHIINNLNGSQVLVTADHGFLFQETPPAETDKSALPEKPLGTVLAKKRYLFGRKLPDTEGAWHGSTAVTANAEGDMEFWIPKGANRFHFTGGARFIHGGAMLQEIVVPIVEVKHIRGKEAPKTKSKQVMVHVLGGNHKITTPRHRFELLQMEAVSDRVKPITLKVAIYDGDELVTNIETVTFDSASDNMNERKKWVYLVLLEKQYDKKKPYRLVLRDTETGIEQESVEVTIDRAFTEDF